MWSQWALESITMNKACGGDGVPVELFLILKDDAVKVLNSICQQIWKTQQWPQDWKRSVFIPSQRKTMKGKERFSYFLQFKSEFGNKEFMIWATVSSRSCFCWLYRASPSLAAKNIINLISVLTIWWCPCVESSLVLLEEGVCFDQCIFLAKLS